LYGEAPGRALKTLRAGLFLHTPDGLP
jgi:hypothetical protein